MSFGRAVQPVISRTIAIGSGALLWGSPSFILLAESLGHAVGAYATLRALPRRPRFRLCIRHHAYSQVFRTLTKFRDSSIFGSLANLAPLIFLLSLQVFIAATFSVSEAGYFVLATSIIALPVSSCICGMGHAPVAFSPKSAVLACQLPRSVSSPPVPQSLPGNAPPPWQ